MCSAVEVREGEGTLRIYFTSAWAALPVMLQGGAALGSIRWGRRSGEAGSAPLGGWVDLKTVEQGGWEQYRPQRGFALVKRFMTMDAASSPHWFDLAARDALDCLVVDDGNERRVYLVTIAPPLAYNSMRDHWPIKRNLDTA